jgi:hypothetical protein
MTRFDRFGQDATHSSFVHFLRADRSLFVSFLYSLKVPSLHTSEATLNSKQTTLKMNSMSNVNTSILHDSFHKNTEAPSSHSTKNDDNFHTRSLVKQKVNEWHREVKGSSLSLLPHFEQEHEHKQNVDDHEEEKPMKIYTKFCKECLNILNAWLADHPGWPYPNRTEIEHLSKSSDLTHTQVRDWFTNIRKRKLKPKKRSVSSISDDCPELEFLTKSSRKRVLQDNCNLSPPPVFKRHAYGYDRPMVTPYTPRHVVRDDTTMATLYHEKIARVSPFELNILSRTDPLLEGTNFANRFDDVSMIDIDVEALLEDDDDEDAEFKKHDANGHDVPSVSPFTRRHHVIGDYTALVPSPFRKIARASPVELVVLNPCDRVLEDSNDQDQVVDDVIDDDDDDDGDDFSIVDDDIQALLQDDDKELSDQINHFFLTMEAESSTALDAEHTEITRCDVQENQSLIEGIDEIEAFMCEDDFSTISSSNDVEDNDDDDEFIETPSKREALDSFKVQLWVADEWLMGKDGYEYGLMSSFYSENI